MSVFIATPALWLSFCHRLYFTPSKASPDPSPFPKPGWSVAIELRWEVKIEDQILVKDR